MKRRPRHNHSPVFKAKVALAIAKGIISWPQDKATLAADTVSSIRCENAAGLVLAVCRICDRMVIAFDGLLCLCGQLCQSLAVVGKGDECPFIFDVFDATQMEAGEAED